MADTDMSAHDDPTRRQPTVDTTDGVVDGVPTGTVPIVYASPDPTEAHDLAAPEDAPDGASDDGEHRTVQFRVPRVGPRLRRRWASTGRGVRSIRARVVIGYVLLVAAALAVTMLVVRQILLVRTDAQIEAQLVQEVEELERLAVEGIDPGTGEPFGTDVQAIFDTFLARNVPATDEIFLTIVDGAPYLETVGAPADLTDDAALVRRWSELEAPLRLDVGEGDLEARTLAVPLLDADDAAAGVFVVAIFPANELAEVDQAVRIIGLVGLLVLAVAGVVALGLAGRVLQPVTELTSTARRVNDNDLTARFDPRGDDELALLGRSFNDMLDRLESGFAAQRDVLDDVAHELRTPITIVRGHLELVEDDPEERAATVQLCLDELDRMGRYVNELLLIASAQRPDFLDPGPVDVGELAESLFAKLRPLGERDWHLRCVVPPGRTLIEADEDRLTQAVVNLANNAVQHTGTGDRIELSVMEDGEFVRLSISDSGPGVSPEVREQLFGRFSRTAGSRSSRPEGTGLGLAIVAAVTEAHGGTVHVDDAPLGGARFTIAVPQRAPLAEEGDA